MNHIPDAASLPKGMAHYWFELDTNNNYFLFCQTSDQKIFHATKQQLMEFIGSKNNSSQSLLLKPWNLIEANGKRTRTGEIKGEKEEEEEEEEEEKKEEEGQPKKKKRKVVVLPAPVDPILPWMPPEIWTMILDGMSRPDPVVRRFIFNALEGSTPNLVSSHLSNSRIIWKWYLEILDSKPPPGFAQLELYYKKRGDINGFARRWYSAFVAQYDLREMRFSPGFFYHPTIKHAIKKRLSPAVLQALMMHVRGRTIGSGRGRNVMDYQEMEIEIRNAMDFYPKPREHDDVPMFLTVPLRHALVELMKTPYMSPTEFREYNWRGPHQGWFTQARIQARFKLVSILGSTMNLGRHLTQVMRGVEQEHPFTARDIIAYIWLSQMIVSLFGVSFSEALENDTGVFATVFMFNLQEKIRFDKMSTEEQETENMISVADRHLFRGQREKKYYETKFESQKAWVKKWGSKKPKKMTKGKEKEEEEEEMSSSTSTSSKIETIQFWN